VEYWGTKGFFSSYDAKPNDPIDVKTAGVWLVGFSDQLQGKLDAEKVVNKVAMLPHDGESSFSTEGWAGMLQTVHWPLKDSSAALAKARPKTIRDPQHLSRAEACEWLFRFLNEAAQVGRQ
jgi:hypothetical protein